MNIESNNNNEQNEQKNRLSEDHENLEGQLNHVEALAKSEPTATQSKLNIDPNIADDLLAEHNKAETKELEANKESSRSQKEHFKEQYAQLNEEMEAPQLQTYDNQAGTEEKLSTADYLANHKAVAANNTDVTEGTSVQPDDRNVLG